MSAIQKYKELAKEADEKNKRLESQLETMRTGVAQSEEERAWFLVLLCAPPSRMGLLTFDLQEKAPACLPTPEKLQEAKEFLALKYPTLNFG